GLAALAPARGVAVRGVAAPTGVIAKPRLVPARSPGATTVGRPRRAMVTCLGTGGAEQRPYREQHCDRNEVMSSNHGRRCPVMEIPSLKGRRERGSYGVKCSPIVEVRT